MSKKDVVEVGCKLLGVYVVLQGLSYLMMAAVQIPQLGTQVFSIGQKITVLISTILPGVLILGVAYGLIRGAETIAGGLVDDAEIRENEDGLDKVSLEEIAFSAAGVLVLATAIAYIPGCLTQILVPPAFANGSPLPGWSELAGVAIRATLGFYLILGSKGLVNLVHRLRSA